MSPSPFFSLTVQPSQGRVLRMCVSARALPSGQKRPRDVSWGLMCSGHCANSCGAHPDKKLPALSSRYLEFPLFRHQRAKYEYELFISWIFEHRGVISITGAFPPAPHQKDGRASGRWDGERGLDPNARKCSRGAKGGLCGPRSPYAPGWGERLWGGSEAVSWIAERTERTGRGRRGHRKGQRSPWSNWV